MEKFGESDYIEFEAILQNICPDSEFDGVGRNYESDPESEKSETEYYVKGRIPEVNGYPIYIDKEDVNLQETIFQKYSKKLFFLFWVLSILVVIFVTRKFSGGNKNGNSDIADITDISDIRDSDITKKAGLSTEKDSETLSAIRSVTKCANERCGDTPRFRSAKDSARDGSKESEHNIPNESEFDGPNESARDEEPRGPKQESPKQSHGDEEQSPEQQYPCDEEQPPEQSHSSDEQASPEQQFPGDEQKSPSDRKEPGRDDDSEAYSGGDTETFYDAVQTVEELNFWYRHVAEK